MKYLPRFGECDVYVQLSRHEAGPLSLNDALALGKPAIVSDRIGATSHDEIVQLEHVKFIEPTVRNATEAIIRTVADLDSLTPAARRALPGLHDFFLWTELHGFTFGSTRRSFSTRCWANGEGRRVKRVSLSGRPRPGRGPGRRPTSDSAAGAGKQGPTRTRHARGRNDAGRP
jgi:hypothetical protein